MTKEPFIYIFDAMMFLVVAILAVMHPEKLIKQRLMLVMQLLELEGERNPQKLLGGTDALEGNGRITGSLANGYHEWNLVALYVSPTFACSQDQTTHSSTESARYTSPEYKWLARRSLAIRTRPPRPGLIPVPSFLWDEQYVV
jgi:hypothetical protein